MQRRTRFAALGLMVGVFLLLTAARLNAQVQTDTQTTAGNASKTVQVERGEVVMVQGNDLIVKMADGTIRHFPNIPDSSRINVDGKSLGIHDLKPGMKLELELHAGLQVMNAQRLAVNVDSGTVWDVWEMADRAICHFYDQVVALNHHDFPAFDLHSLAGITGSGLRVCLDLSVQARRSEQKKHANHQSKCCEPSSSLHL